MGAFPARSLRSHRRLTPTQRGLLRDEDRYNQLGGSIGGPIWKNKIFAFFSYEGQSQTVPATGTGWYMTSALAAVAPTNSIASKYLNFKGAAVLGTVIGSATCADAGLTEGVNCRTIPGQGLNIGTPLTTGLGTQDMGWSSPTSPGTGGDGKGGANNLGTVADIANFQTASANTASKAQYNGRLDWDVTL